jgi:rhodanese-related sulfurtransferase
VNPNELPLEITSGDVAALRAAGANLLLIDCREPDEAAICSIDGAALMPMSVFADRVGELGGQEHERIVVHCHLGGRSYRVARWLRDQGFSQAQSMAGGIDQWAVDVAPGMTRY